MPRPYSSGLVPATADQVWSVVRDFNGLPGWFSVITNSEIEQGSNGMVGCVRKLTLGDGGVVRERLVALDDTDRSYTYEFTDPGPFPVRSYRSTVRVAPVTDTGEAFVEWWAWYDSEAADEAAMTDTFATGVYATAIAELKARFSR